MNKLRFLPALLALLPLSAAIADEDDQGWDVNAIPGESRTVDIDTREGTWMSRPD